MPEPHVPLLIQSLLMAVFGSLLGSFSNVVILRMAEGRSVVFPPSACPHCHHELSPLDLIPVFGWLLLGGACRYCRAPISWQYPLVEFAAALILGSSFWICGDSPLLVPTAAWGMIWLVQAVLLAREEMRAPGPFLWPIPAFLLLSWLAGAGFRPVQLAAFAVGGAAGWLASRGPAPGLFFPWFGSGVTVGLAHPVWGWWGPAALVLLAGLFPRVPAPGGRRALKAMVVVLHALGIALTIGLGVWRP